MPQGRARVLVKLDGKLMLEAGQFQPEGLPARPGADLHHPVLPQLTSSLPTGAAAPLGSIMAETRTWRTGHWVRNVARAWAALGCWIS